MGINPRCCPSRCSRSCGFSSQYSTWTNTTLSGTLAFSHSGFVVNLTGSGSAVLVGTANISGLISSTQAWSMIVRGPVQDYANVASSGRFWIGIPGSVGVCYDYAAGQVQEVTLASDGSIASVDHTCAWTKDDFAAMAYGGFGQPVVTLVWERFTSGDRYTIGPSGLSRIARAHVSRTMETSDFTVCIGAEFTAVPVPKTSYSLSGVITGEIGCGVPSRDCRLCPDMPTPGIARITGSWSLTGYSGSRGTPDFTGLNDPLAVFGDELRPANRQQVGDDGVYWVSECQWGQGLTLPNPATSPITFTPGSVLQSGWIVNEGTGALLAKNLTWPYGVGCSAAGSAPASSFSWPGLDPSKYQLAVHDSIAYGPSGTPINDLTWVVATAMYQAGGDINCLSTNTFSKLGETWSAPYVAGIPASLCQAAWVSGFPSSLTVEFL